MNTMPHPVRKPHCSPSSNYMKYILLLSIISIIYSHPVTAQGSAEDSTILLPVSGACSMCKTRIEAAAQGRGVSSVVWDLSTQQLKLVFQPALTTLDKVVNRIVAVGHDAGGKKADDAIYQALPECCLYRTTPADTDTDSSYVKGVVLEETGKGQFIPLLGATVQWLGSSNAVLSDTNGVFRIQAANAASRLVISYSGYKADTINVLRKEELMIILAKGGQLGEVVVTARQRTTYISARNPLRTQVMTEKELFKAACCNLSESFETNPAVDVSYSDAVTGSKQIQLLGLSGNYTQLTVENLPGPRGIATPMGLNTIAGPWIESIQLTKGTGSVANGFESMAGQINVELKKPDEKEKLYLNLYRNNMNKSDVNLNLSQQVGKKWGTSLLLHGDFLNDRTIDFNGDRYRDLPTGSLWSGIHRWKFEDGKGWIVQFGIKGLTDRKTGGRVEFDPADHKGTTTYYGLGMATDRFEAFSKTGYVFPAKKYKSIGLQLSAFQHRQSSYFGLTTYEGQQQNLYGNLLYQSIISDTRHKFRTGLSFVADRYREQFNALAFKRNENVGGAFFEYTWEPKEAFTLVAGMRIDHNNLYGWFATPRLHLRYEPVKGSVLRLSAGRGQRTANILAENTGIFVSSRALQITGNEPRGAYGLLPEIAWNKGISFDQQFRLLNRTASLNIDFFRNDFQQQVVTDLEDARTIRFYNLDGQSYSNSFQAELNLQPANKFDVRMAYRYFEVKTTYGNQLLLRPFTATHRAFLNLAWEVKKWKFDHTTSYLGPKRIPGTGSNPAQYQLPGRSPAYVLMNAQVSRVVGKKYPVELYLGGENLTNFFQQDVIVAGENPFGPYFDASLVWGPVTGRMIYAGLRFKLK